MLAVTWHGHRFLLLEVRSAGLDWFQPAEAWFIRAV
jgi:hypothetical protein